MKNMVIAKYLDGKMVRGSTLDVGNKDTFHLTTVEGETREIRISDLKAVFFVKSLTGAAKFAGGARPLIVGKKVRVKFFDNEEIEGTSIDYAQRKDHFFIFPLDEKSNNERILINRKAARFVTTVDEAPPRRPPPRKRSRRPRIRRGSSWKASCTAACMPSPNSSTRRARASTKR
jgi:hypothetical protein